MKVIVIEKFRDLKTKSKEYPQGKDRELNEVFNVDEARGKMLLDKGWVKIVDNASDDKDNKKDNSIKDNTNDGKNDKKDNNTKDNTNDEEMIIKDANSDIDNSAENRKDSDKTKNESK